MMDEVIIVPMFCEDPATETFFKTTHVKEAGKNLYLGFVYVEGKGWLGSDGVYRSQKPRNLRELQES